MVFYEVVSQSRICVWGHRSNTALDIYPLGHVVAEDNGRLQMNGIAKEVRQRSPLLLPVAWNENHIMSHHIVAVVWTTSKVKAQL